MRYGGNIRKCMNIRNNQMKYILENMKEPVFYNECKVENIDALTDVFNMETKDAEDEVFDKEAITYRLMNHQGFGNKHHDGNPTYHSVVLFMKSIQDYLPKSLRSKGNYTLWCERSFISTNTLGKETTELLDQMVEWLEIMREKIEDSCTRKFIGGHNVYLEVLKRRFRTEWADSKIVDVTADANVKADVKEDLSVNIVFKDA